MKHCLPGKHRDLVSKAFIRSWSHRHARPNVPPNFRLSEGKQVLNINYIVGPVRPYGELVSL